MTQLEIAILWKIEKEKRERERRVPLYVPLYEPPPKPPEPENNEIDFEIKFG